MPAQTLFKMATQAAIRLSAQINDIADMPYHLARPILLKIQNPQQLRDIEVNCPQVAEASEELWKAFIARDIPDWENKIVRPTNKSSWYKVYRYLQRKEEKNAAEDEENLRKALAGEGLKKAENQALFVKKVLPHARAEDEHNFYIDGVPNKKLNGWGQAKQPTLKNAKNGTEMLGALRRQAADASRARAMAKPFVPQTAQQRLASAKRQITTPPPAMVQQAGPNRPLTIAPRDLHPHEKVLMKEIQKEKATRKIQPPARMSNVKLAERHQATVEAETRKAREENEAKLRALTQKGKRASASSPPSKPFDFAPSPIVIDPARRSPPSTTPASKTPTNKTPVASPPAADSAPSPPKQPVASVKEGKSSSQISPPDKPVAAQAKSMSPEASSPPKMVRKRPAPSIFMNTNKKRKI